LESHYWWKGRLESAAEVLLVLKTRRSLLKKLEALVLEHHPYSTPEFIALPLLGGNMRYLRWLGAECPAK
jgi:periplasmic divalent cation tolerance protein